MQTVSDVKLLGDKLCDKLQWGDQVEQVKAKALQALGLTKHAKKVSSNKLSAENV